MRNYLLLLAALFGVVPAQAALKFQARGTQLAGYYCTTYCDWGSRNTSGTQNPALVSDNSAGIFGGSKINVISGSVGGTERAIQYVGMDNFTLGATYTILLRLVPTWTGNPAATQGAFAIGASQGAVNGGMYIRLVSDGTVSWNLRDKDDGFTSNSSSAVSWVSGTAVDLWFVSTGATGAGGLQIWAAQNGNSPTKIGNFSGVSIPSRVRPNIAGIVIGADPFANGLFYLNEFAIWDTAFDPAATYGARSTFISTSAFDGSVNTSAGAANIRSGSTEVIAGTTITGTAAIPARGDVRLSVAVDASTGLLDLPGVADVRKNTQFDQTTKTGLAYIPAAANVRSGTNTDQTTGSLAVPARADVRLSVAVDASTGLLDLPGVADVRKNTQFDQTTKTGLAYVPVAGDVRSGTHTDQTTGTLAVPARADVRLGSSVDASTGLLVAPSLANTAIGVAGDGGTGLFDGSARWTCPTAGQLSAGVQLQCNSTSANLTGTRQTVTNIMQSATMTGPSYSATLTAY